MRGRVKEILCKVLSNANLQLDDPPSRPDRHRVGAGPTGIQFGKDAANLPLNCGIGKWSDAQFLRAVHQGISADGSRLGTRAANDLRPRM